VTVLISGFDHVQTAIPQGGEQQARALYGGLLGFSEVTKPPVLAARGGIWFVAPSLHLHLGTEDPFVPARKAHVALLVEDLDAARAALHAAGIATTDDDADIGVARFYAADPFGNRIEFVSQRDRGFTTAFE
jgi:catechol 2,3-dioxygenase-like lactoylglutathione lyase family enzyme